MLPPRQVHRRHGRLPRPSQLVAAASVRLGGHPSSGGDAASRCRCHARLTNWLLIRPGARPSVEGGGRAWPRLDRSGTSRGCNRTRVPGGDGKQDGRVGDRDGPRVFACPGARGWACWAVSHGLPRALSLGAGGVAQACLCWNGARRLDGPRPRRWNSPCGPGRRHCRAGPLAAVAQRSAVTVTGRRDLLADAKRTLAVHQSTRAREIVSSAPPRVSYRSGRPFGGSGGRPPAAPGPVETSRTELMAAVYSLPGVSCRLFWFQSRWRLPPPAVDQEAG